MHRSWFIFFPCSRVFVVFVGAQYLEEDLGDVDHESVKDQAEVIEERDEMQDILDEQNRMQEILDEQNSFSSRSSKSDSANQRNQGRVIFGLDQQKTTRQKVSDWFDKN